MIKTAVLDVLGLVDDIYLSRLMEAVFSRNVGMVIEMLGQALKEGKEVQQIAREAVLYLRDLLVYSLLGAEAEFAVVTDSARPYLDKLRNKTEPAQIIKALNLLMSGADRLRFSEGNRFQWKWPSWNCSPYQERSSRLRPEPPKATRTESPGLQKAPSSRGGKG